MTQEEWMKKLDSQGVEDLTVVNMEPGEKLEHTHDLPTIHVILAGDLTVTDKNGTHSYKPGDYIEFPVETTHSVVFGPQGLKMIVGVRK